MQVLALQTMFVVILTMLYFRVSGFENIEIREGRRAEHSRSLAAVKWVTVVLAASLPFTGFVLLVSNVR